MRIALAQINPVVGDFKANYAKIISFINKAKAKKAGLVVFGELSLCGYPPEDLLFKKSFIEANRRYLEKIRKQIKGDMLVVLGFVAKEDGKVFNSLAVLSRKKVLDIYHKVCLPNYSVFDEKRYFTSGDQARIYLYENIKLAATICEDVWSDKFFAHLKKDHKPDIIINISASPFFAGKFAMRKKILSQRARSLKSTVLYCNIVGGQDELVFDGSSLVINAQGKVILSAKRFEEDLLIYDTARRYSLKSASVDKVEEMHKSLVLGIRDYVQKNDFKKVVIGVSGGIDSAVTLSLAKEALGSPNVLGLLMPSRYTSRATLNDAIKLCRNLKVKYHIIPIDGVFFSYLNRLEPYLKDDRRYDIACQNIQARIRGNILMSFSNRFGYLVLNTGNKSEISVGYCTLYGDMVGGYGVLKDLYKTKVYRLAQIINKQQRLKVIPVSVIRRAPSAELKPDQKDENDIPPYKILDKILKLYIEDDHSKDTIVRLGFKRRLVDRVIGMVDRNEYKRRQAPPGIKITPKAFGRDRRMPITNKFSL